MRGALSVTEFSLIPVFLMKQLSFWPPQSHSGEMSLEILQIQLTNVFLQISSSSPNLLHHIRKVLQMKNYCFWVVVLVAAKYRSPERLVTAFTKLLNLSLLRIFLFKCTFLASFLITYLISLHQNNVSTVVCHQDYSTKLGRIYELQIGNPYKPGD